MPPKPPTERDVLEQIAEALAGMSASMQQVSDALHKVARNLDALTTEQRRDVLRRIRLDLIAVGNRITEHATALTTFGREN